MQHLPTHRETERDGQSKCGPFVCGQKLEAWKKIAVVTHIALVYVDVYAASEGSKFRMDNGNLKRLFS